MQLTFADIQATTAARDVIITPDGRRIPFSQRGQLVMSVFNMTPVEFQKRYKVSADDGLVTLGYIYANKGVIQVEGDENGLTEEHVQQISDYVLSMPPNTQLEVMVLQHDPKTYALLKEELVFVGTINQLKHMLDVAARGTPSVGGGLPFQESPALNYVPTKSTHQRDSPQNTWTRDFSFPLSVEKPTTVGGLRFSDIVDVRPESEKVTLADSDYFGLPIIKYNEREWMLATDKQADKAAYAYIMDSLWAFNTDFLADYMPLTPHLISELQRSSEASNDTLKALLRQKRQFVQDAIAADGRGHFLSSYDGVEYDLSDLGLTVEELPPNVLRRLKITRDYTETIYAYRTN